MKITIEIEDQPDNDAVATCAFLEMVLRDNEYTVKKITWSGSHDPYSLS